MPRTHLSGETGGPTVDWLFLDLNAYFASVEQQERPELRGKPIAIVPLITEHTCCIAASYEAKAYGIKTGVNLEDAKALCPGLNLVEARPKLYVDYHHRIVEAVETCVPISSVMSIDEMACRLIGRERDLTNAIIIAKDVKQALRGVGDTLRCSIGLAPNRYLSKVAGDMQKPDGLVVFLKEQLPQALFKLKPSDLSGIGARMEVRLKRQGIETMEQLCALTAQQMRAAWNSVIGERLWYWLRGEDFHDPEFKRKSIGKQHVLAPEFRTRDKAYGVALKLLHTAAANMRRLDMWANGIGVAVHFMQNQPRVSNGKLIEASSWEAHRRIYECRDTFTLQRYLGELWRGCPPSKPLQVCVWLYHLVSDDLRPLALFDDIDVEKKFKACAAMDRLNLKYGTQTVFLGGMHGTRHSAPTRISFMSIPKLDEF